MQCIRLGSATRRVLASRGARAVFRTSPAPSVPAGRRWMSTPPALDRPVIAAFEPQLVDLFPQLEDPSEHRLVQASRSASNPFTLAAPDLQNLSQRIQNVLGTSHAILENIATYILDQDGHRELRPTVTVLMSRAVQAHLSGERQAHVDDSQSQSQSQSATARLDPRQQLLAEIAELIHTASLLHRDVMDRDDDGASGRRRNSGAINYNIGNKLAVLAGDFLLSRASVELAKIRDLRVTELVSAVIGDIAEGGVLRDSPSDHLLLRSAAGDHHENDNTGHSETVVKAFFSRAYLADGSLIANTCRSSALLAADFMTLDDPAQVAQLETAAFQFGVHAAVAKQLNTEATLLDALVAHITSLKGSHAEDAGRDASAGDMADMDVFAFTGEHGVPLVSLAAAVAEGDASEWNQAAEANDCARVVDLIASNDCAAKLRGHALSHAAHAMSALQHLDPSEPREALMRLAYELATSPPRAQED